MSVIHSREIERGSAGEHGAVLDKNWKKLIKLLSVEPTWWCFVRGGVTPRLARLVESLSFFKYL